MHFCPGDFTAEYTFHQIQIIPVTAYHRGQPDYIPGSDLTLACRREGCWGLNQTTPEVDLSGTTQHLVKRRFTRQINPFICQLRHDLRRRQADIFRLMTDIPYLLLFLYTQKVCGHRTNGQCSAVFRLNLPALSGSLAEVNFTTGHHPAGTCCNRFIDPLDKQLTPIAWC